MDQLEYYDNILCEYAESIFQKMASKKYGIKFCCEMNLVNLSIKKEKLELNLKSDCKLI